MKSLGIAPGAYCGSAQFFAGVLAVSIAVCISAPTPAFASAPVSLSEKLTSIRNKVMGLEQSLLDSAGEQSAAKLNIKKIQSLIKLQQEESKLGRQRMTELEKTIGELQERRGVLRERIKTSQTSIRRSLADIERSMVESPRTLKLYERERIEAPRRKALSRLVDRNLKEVEALKVDLADADQLENRIQDEQQQLAYLFQDLKEQEGILEFNRRLQIDMLKKSHDERIGQLQRYRDLKSAETQVEGLIQNFNSRLELERTIENERIASKSAFAQLKGRLPFPVMGKVVSNFGRSFDAKSSLHIFKKGIDIEAGKGQAITAIHAGKVAYSGFLPNYGQVTIIDHGDHFYSLCAHLGELKLKVGDQVARGDLVGMSDSAGTPVYFEIRARNIAVNPLQWVSN